VTAADRSRFAHFTREDAIHLLRADVAKVEHVIATAVRAGIRERLNQNQYDALVSLGFNIGTSGLAGSTVLRELNAGRARRAADAFLMWRNPPELLPRRRRERALFLKSTRDPRLAVLTRAEYDAVHAYRVHRDPAHREVLVTLRKRIWRAAQHDPQGPRMGWASRHRKARYELLREEARH
jgi:hypothetical protein